MSLTATFIKTTSPNNRLEKVDGGGTAIQSSTISVTLKAPTDLLRPTLLVDDFNQNEDCFDYNYVTIGFTDTHQRTRMYFITGWRIIRNNLYEVDCREDVLATYETEILAENVFIERSSYGYNVGIYDRLANRQYIPYVDSPDDVWNFTQIVPSGNILDFRQKGLTIQSTDDLNVYCVCVARSGETNLSPDEPEGNLDSTLINGTFNASMFPSVYMYCCDFETMRNLVKYCKENASDAESVISIAKYPFALPHGTEKRTTIRLGGKDVSTGAEEAKSTYYFCGIQPIVLADFSWSNAQYVNTTYRWMNGDGTYRLYLPYIGYINLPISSIDNGNEIQVVYIPFLPYNITLVAVMNVTKQLVIHISEITLGEEIPLVTSNVQNIRDQWISTGVKVGVSAVADIMKLAFGTDLMKLSAIKSVVSNVGDAVTKALTTHETDAVRMSSPVTSECLPYKVYLQMTYYEYVGYGTSAYLMRFGLPVMSSNTLSSKQSTTDVFVKTDIDYLPTEIGNDTERAEIIRLLNQGIILPPKSST